MGEYKPIPRTASHLFPAPVLPYTRSVAESSGRSVIKPKSTQQGCETGDPTITVWPRPGSADVVNNAGGSLDVGDQVRPRRRRACRTAE
jgi:hypothetical protein